MFLIKLPIKSFLILSAVLVMTFSLNAYSGNENFKSLDCNEHFNSTTAVEECYAYVDGFGLGDFFLWTGNNYGYSYQGFAASVVPDEALDLSLIPGYYCDLGETFDLNESDEDPRFFWRIYIDLNKDGVYQHGLERVFQGNEIGDLYDELVVPSHKVSEYGYMSMMVTVGLDGYVFPDEYGAGEREEYSIFLVDCSYVADSGYIGYDQIICSEYNDPYTLGGEVGGDSDGLSEIEDFSYELIWVQSTSNSGSPDSWDVIPGANEYEYDPPPLSETTYFARGKREFECQEFSFTNVVQIYYTDDCSDTCADGGDNSENEYIDRFRFADLYNISKDDGGFGNYSHIMASAMGDESVYYVLRPRMFNGPRTQYWRVWIDLDSDGFFSDDEIIVDESGDNTINGYVTIPYGYYGYYTMQVAMSPDGPPSGCGAFDNGEAELYTIHIYYDINTSIGHDDGADNQSAVANTEVDFEELDEDIFMNDFEQGSFTNDVVMRIMPNPTTGSIRIDVENFEDENVIEIVNQVGQRVYKLDNISQGELQIDLNQIGLNPGLYFVNYRSQNQSLSKKIFFVNR